MIEKSKVVTFSLKVGDVGKGLDGLTKLFTQFTAELTFNGTVFEYMVLDQPGERSPMCIRGKDQLIKVQELIQEALAVVEDVDV